MARDEPSTSAPAGGPAPGKPLTAKRALEMHTEDCKRLCTANLNKPFATLQDAVDALVPFHVRTSPAADAPTRQLYPPKPRRLTSMSLGTCSCGTALLSAQAAQLPAQTSAACLPR
jgi:hypothetical protein